MCAKPFTQNGALNYHQHVHTGERPYTCHVCSKSFSEKSMFKRHQVVHTESGLFSCVGNKTFKLKKHLRIIFSCTVQSMSLILKSIDLRVMHVTSDLVKRTIIKMSMATY
jgi:uncharacterized Zn-finger protein